MRPEEEFHVIPEKDGWSIAVDEEAICAPRPTRSIAVCAAESLARKQPGSRIVVHTTDGSVAVDYPTPTGRVDPPPSWKPV